MASTTILIAGATGYLGSRLVRRLCNMGNCRVIALKRRSSDMVRLADMAEEINFYDVETGGLEAAFRENAIDIAINCSADYGRGGAMFSRVAAANLSFPLRLLEAGQKAGVAALINTHTALPRHINAYSLSKHQFVDWLRQSSGDFACINIVPEHFFGPGEGPERFVAFLVDRFLSNAPEIALTPGRQKRDFVYIDDVVESYLAVIAAINGFRSGYHEFEVGTGCPVELRELITTVQRLTGNKQTRLCFGAVPYRADEVMHSCSDLRQIKNLGWRPRTTLAEGLRRTIEHEIQLRKDETRPRRAA